ncbi:MAG TPA: hypothetical protein VF783_14545 [Terriglobales bacterium]
MSKFRLFRYQTTEHINEKFAGFDPGGSVGPAGTQLAGIFQAVEASPQESRKSTMGSSMLICTTLLSANWSGAE